MWLSVGIPMSLRLGVSYEAAIWLSTRQLHLTISGDISYVSTYDSYLRAYICLLHMVIHTRQQVSSRMSHVCQSMCLRVLLNNLLHR